MCLNESSENKMKRICESWTPNLKARFPKESTKPFFTAIIPECLHSQQGSNLKILWHSPQIVPVIQKLKCHEACTHLNKGDFRYLILVIGADKLLPTSTSLKLTCTKVILNLVSYLKNDMKLSLDHLTG